MHYVASAWAAVNASTAQHCFARCGFRVDGEVETAIEAEEPEAAFCEQELTEAMNALGATGVTYDDYVAVDAALVTSECQSTAEIVANAVASEVGDRDDDDEHEPQDSAELADPSFGDAVAALDLLRSLHSTHNCLPARTSCASANIRYKTSGHYQKDHEKAFPRVSKAMA
ncbi:hypothetical protein HPB50_000489 [Hyalomma asiaticum]|uniref:Uncharacterized protein n=1 Tax=Hyalomma asiaticum TaxID=266040 RepID=A0ACB7RR39_HYAAI|nr:hypothetical protein HPB50_000489 [Hyalomma asiaticum]